MQANGYRKKCLLISKNESEFVLLNTVCSLLSLFLVSLLCVSNEHKDVTAQGESCQSLVIRVGYMTCCEGSGELRKVQAL